MSFNGPQKENGSHYLVDGGLADALVIIEKRGHLFTYHRDSFSLATRWFGVKQGGPFQERFCEQEAHRISPRVPSSVDPKD